MQKLIMLMNMSLDGCTDHRVAIADDELHDFATAQYDKTDLELF